MPSVSNKQEHLMAACAHGALYKKCPPLKVAREYNRADMLKRSAGGTTTPLESGMDSKLNFGMGHGNSFFSTTPLMGHALTGSLPRKYAEGGEVKKPAGPSAKERKEIREIIERGKEDAVTALRATRTALASASPDAALEDIRSRLAMKDGGEVAAADDPEMLYNEYLQLLDGLQDPQLDPASQNEMVDRIADLADQLEAMGIDVTDGESPG